MPGVKGRSGGHNAKTASELALTGGFKKSRHEGLVSPEPPSGTPMLPRPFPEELAREASAEWDRMIGRLDASKTISPVDDGALYQYCCLFAETEILVEEKAEARVAVDTLLASQGDLEKSDLLPFFIELGKMKKLAAGYDSKLRSSRMALMRLLTEFGLTPASRGRVKMRAEAPKDEWSEFDSPAQ
jgi:P27 family predicted phage terminase small subunit